ncbi:MAG: HD domain-containing protein [Clostridiales bacterium]|nr:HD domain-containing protein [Clostridiales bacterium]
MLIENKISIYDFVNALSDMVDLVSPLMGNHHTRVAYLAWNLAQKMHLSNEEIQDITLAAMLHDIGAFSVEEQIMLQTFEPYGGDTDIDNHAFVGYKLLRNFEPLAQAANLIRYHHAEYHPTKQHIPLGSHVIHLADRMAVLLDENREIFMQLPDAFAAIDRQRAIFHPLALAALDELAELEYVWIEVFSKSLDSPLINKTVFSKDIYDMETLRSFSRVIGQIIDFRNRFTATHSSGVAAVSMELAKIVSFSEKECKQMEIAGFLHDLGKLAVSNEILEKKGDLNYEEINSIRKHTYYTYSVLSKIQGMEQIAVWAAYHHERQDGNGYPFHIDSENFPLPARIMAVADIVTALTEDRPYRPGMDKERAMEILFSMVEDGGVDRIIAEIAERNFERINTARTNANIEARREYESFNGTTILNFSEVAI